jgi:5-methylcytosine-specific restriction protein A
VRRSGVASVARIARRNEQQRQQMAWSKESRQSRGYGAAWDKLRKQVMQRDCGICQTCRKQGRVTIAQAVDHIRSKAKGGTDDLDNLAAICNPCHAIKTQEEQGKTLRVKLEVGPDGWPVIKK